MRRIFSAVTVVALGALIPFGASGQGSLTIGNYQLVEEVQKVTRTISDFRYKADVINTTGIARPTLTATLTSNVATVQAVQATLHFVNVPGNGQVTSTDTFIIRVDRSVAFDFASLTWTFPPIDAPVANAGPDQTVALGTTVTLNGSGSTNPSGVGTLTYSWAFTARPVGSTAALTNPTSITPTFVADLAGIYNVALTVSNGVVASAPDSVVITTGNTAPVANAGPNQTVPLGATVTLNGGGSTDADGNPLTYAWTLTGKPAGSTATLTGANTISPTFVADKSTIGTTPYTVQLVVNDGLVNSNNTAIVTISTSNTKPVANAGPDQTVALIGAVVQLTGAASTDADGNPLTYAWSLIARPTGSTATLSSTTVVNPTFTADLPGPYVAQLIVNDGQISSDPDTVSISNNPGAPIANAGPDQTVVHGATVTLNGSASTPQPVTYLWSLTTKPTNSVAVLANPTSATPTFVADLPGQYVAQLIVNNGVASLPDTVLITTTNTPPATNAGPDQNVQTGATVTLTGSLTTDPDNDPITYLWTFNSRPAGSTATLTGSTTISPTFVADVAGPYVIQLIASDPFIAGQPATVMVTAVTPQAIILPGTTNVALGASTAFAVTLPSPAPAGGTTVTLVITDATKVSLSTLTVAIAAGATAPTTQPQVTGLAVGSSTITASAPSFTSASGNVIVSFSATATLTPTPLNIVGTATQNLTLTLSAPAPAGGVTFTVSSTNTGAATVPASLTIAPGATTVSVPVTGVAAGTATINATATGVTVTPATVNVVALLSITTASPLLDAQVGTAYSQTLAATGGTPPYTWALTAGTLPAGLTFNTSTGQITGTPTGPPVTSTPLTFRVTDAGAPPQTASKDFTLSVTQVAASIAATSGTPQSAQINAAFAAPLVATVKDAGGNPVGGVTVTFTAPGSGASGTFAGGGNTATATTNASGVATSPIFTANATAGGPYNVVASVAVAGVTPANFALTNLGPASIAATGGTPQSAAIGAPFAAPLQATVKDAAGNPVPGVTVTFTINLSGAGAGGTFGGANTAVTNASGVATSPIITANAVAGAFTVTAAVAGVATPATFNLANATQADSVTATGGTPQAAFVNAAFPAPLVATVKDAVGNPVAGVTVTFTVNASGPGAGGTFAGGVNTAVSNASGVATSPVFTANDTGGSYTVTASAPGIGDPLKFGTFRLANAPIFVGDPIASSSVSVGQNLEVALNITLPHPTPPGTTQVFLTSLNPDLVLLGQPVNAGNTQVIVPATEGTVNIIGTFAQGMASSGSVQVSVAAVGYGNGTITVNLTPSGFVFVSDQGLPVISKQVAQGSETPLIVAAARLDASLNFAEIQPVRGGLSVTVPLSVSNAKGTVSPASVTFNGGDDTAPVSPGFKAITSGAPDPIVTAGTPAGFLTPAGGANQIAFSITPPSVTTNPVTVGQNLETPTFVTFTPAPDNLTMTLTSNDPSKLLFSLLPGDAGTPTLDVPIEVGRIRSRDFFVHGLTNSGSATYSVNIHQQSGAPAFNFGSGTGTVNFVPSAFAIQGPFGLGQPFITTSGADNTPLTIFSAMVIAGGLEEQFVRGGLTVNVPVVSSNTAVGTITTSPVVFTGGVSQVTTAFDPVNTAPNNSNTTVSITTPPGFGTAPVGSSLTVTVSTPTLSCTDNIAIGKSLQSIATVLLQQPAPAGGLAVTVTSNSANVRLSLSPTTAGSGSVVVNIPAGQASGTYFIQALTDTGSGTYSCAAPLYNPDTATVSFVPSGVVIEGPFGFGFPLITTVAQGQQPVKVSLYPLVPGSNATNTGMGAQQLAGGQSLAVSLANSNPAIGTVPLTVTIAGGSDSVITQFTPLSVGQTTISVIKPAAFSQPSDNTTLTARVNP